MKTVILIVSLVFLIFFGYVFVINLNVDYTFNHLIFMTLLIILKLICIVVSILNFPKFTYKKRKSNSLTYNSYSDKRVKNESFDKHYSYANN